MLRTKNSVLDFYHKNKSVEENKFSESLQLRIGNLKDHKYFNPVSRV